MTSDLDAATFAVALLAFALSLIALTWQAVTFFLSGSRLRCEMLMGAANPLTGKYMTQPVESWKGLSPAMRSQGFTQERVFIVARNKGRGPASVDGFRLVSNTGQSFGQTGTEAWEDKLPKRLEGEAKAMWSFPGDLLADAVEMMRADKDIVQRAPRGVFEMRAEIESGSGKTIQSKQAMTYPATLVGPAIPTS